MKEIFDGNNSSYCTDNAEFNRMFLDRQKQYFNDKLQREGVVKLTEVLEALGFDSKIVAQGLGKVWIAGMGDELVDFGLHAPDSEINQKFLEGRSNIAELEFNTVDIKKEEPCEYCREKTTGYQNSDICEVPINLFNGRSLGHMTLYINEKDRLSMDLYNSYDDPLITCDISIHYCPMCGRRIK